MTKINYYLKRPVEKIGQRFGRWYCNRLTREYFNFITNGIENLTEESAIIVPNHNIWWDGILISLQIERQIHFLVQKEGVYDSKLKFLYWLVGEIPVGITSENSNRTVLKRTRDCLRFSQDYLGIFSEGPTKKLIDNDGIITPLKERVHQPGAAHLATKNNVPIIPVGIYSPEGVSQILWESYDNKNRDGGCPESFSEAWKRNMNYLKNYLKEHGKIDYCINIGLPIYPHEINADSKGQKIAKLTEIVRDNVLGLVEEAKSISSTCHSLE